MCLTMHLSVLIVIALGGARRNVTGKSRRSPLDTSYDNDQVTYPTVFHNTPCHESFSLLAYTKRSRSEHVAMLNGNMLAGINNVMTS